MLWIRVNITFTKRPIASVRATPSRHKYSPYEGIDFLNRVFDLEIRISRFETKFEDEPVYLVHYQSNLDTFLQSVSNDVLSTNHQLLA